MYMVKKGRTSLGKKELVALLMLVHFVHERIAEMVKAAKEVTEEDKAYFWGSMTEKIEVEMEYERSTRNTHRYIERGSPQKIGTLYIQKWAVRGQPRRIKVTVEALE